MGTFTKWKGDELSSNFGMLVHARTTAKRQEGRIEHEGIGDYLQNSNSSIRKLISGKQYLGGYALEQV